MDKNNLDKYLKIVADNKADKQPTQCSVYLKDLGEDFTFRTLTPSEVREVTFSLPYDTKCFQDIYKSKVFKKTIYNCCELAPLATKAKEQNIIATYYDIIDYLFTPTDVLDLWLAIMKENKIGESKNKDDDLKN